jgi:hypothetical protein
MLCRTYEKKFEDFYDEVDSLNASFNDLALRPGFVYMSDHSSSHIMKPSGFSSYEEPVPIYDSEDEDNDEDDAGLVAGPVARPVAGPSSAGPSTARPSSSTASAKPTAPAGIVTSIYTVDFLVSERNSSNKALFGPLGIHLYRFFKSEQCNMPHAEREIFYSPSNGWHGWYNETIILFFLTAFQKEQDGRSDHFQVIDSLESTVDPNDEEIRRLKGNRVHEFLPARFQKFRFVSNVLITYNMNNGHWGLIHVYRTDASVHIDYYDSMHLVDDQTQTFSDKVERYIKSILAAWQYFENRPPIRSFKYNDPQHDAENCGVYVSFAGAMLLLGASSHDITKKTTPRITNPTFMNKMRMYVFETMKNYFVPHRK